MSRSDRERREAEKAARRAKRLAERAEHRAQRKGEQAEAASERAERLAERTKNRRPRDRYRESSIEDLVDDVAEKWSRKATDWLDVQSQNMFGEGELEVKVRRRKAAEHSSGNSAEYNEESDQYEDLTGDEDDQPRKASFKRRARRRATRSRKSRHQLRKRSGHGLYRDAKNKKICGVCAGSAEYLGLEAWQVRMGAIFGLIFMPTLAVPAYFITWFLMDKKPYYREAAERYDRNHHAESIPSSMRERKAKNKTKNKMKSKTEEPDMSNVQALQIAKQKFSHIEEHLREMESHVTSSQFELKREFKKIAGEE